MAVLPRSQPVIAASYERVSTRQQGQYGFSLGAQHQGLDEFCAANGWRLPEHLRFRDGEDADASGTRWDLPDLTRMLDAAREGAFSVLVVPDFDRFARTLAKGLVLEEQLKKYGVRVVYQRVPVEDTPEGQLLKTQLYAFAEYDRQKILLRTMTGKRAKARAGKVVGIGRSAFGLRYTYETLPNGKERVCGLEPDPLTAPLAREVLRALRSRSTVDVMADLNRRGVPAPGGGRWSHKALRRMARNPVYCGTWLYGRHGRAATPDDPDAIPVPVEPLISRAEWDDLQRALDGRRWHRRGRRPADEDPWTLRSLLRCGHCGEAMRTQTSGPVRYYACPRHAPSAARAMDKPPCPLPQVNAAALEAELWRVLDATLLDPGNLAAGLAAGVSRRDEADRLRRDRLAAIDAEIGKQRKRLDGLAGRLVDAGEGELYAALFKQAKEIEALIGRLSDERAALAAVRPEGLSRAEATAIEDFAAEMRAGLAAATPADRRELVGLLDVRGTVHADPEGIRLGRKHRFAIDWVGRIPLRDKGACFRNRRKVNCST